MSTFTKKHYKAVAEIIRDWMRTNPEVTEHLQSNSLINEFIVAFKADSSKFDHIKFLSAING